MNRRSFLTGIIAACAGPAIVRSGLIMPIRPARQLLTIDMITREALRLMHQRLTMGSAGYRVGDLFTMEARPRLFMPPKLQTFMVTVIGRESSTEIVPHPI